MAEPLIALRNVSKTFGHVKALDGVSFDIFPGEVVGLLGDNGAGKSTAIKTLAGIHVPDSGEIQFMGAPVQISDPSMAAQMGIAAVFQDLRLVESRSVAHNVFLGREPRRSRFLLDRKRMEDQTKLLLEDVSINLPSVSVDVELLSGGQRQAVAIARGLAQGGEILLLDEPTAALGVEQTAQVYSLVERMKASGKGVVIVTHDLSDVLTITDRVIVFRLGRVTAIANAGATDIGEVIGWLTGATQGNIEESQ